MIHTHSSHAAQDREHHDVTASHYDELILAPRVAMSNRLFAEVHALLPSPGRMLDLGAGTGQMTLRFGHQFDQVTLVDHSIGMLSRAKHNVSSHPRLAAVDCRFIALDAFAYLETVSEEFDLIACVGFLHHLEPDELSRLLAHCAGLLAANGRMVIAEPVQTSTPIPQAISAWNRATAEKIQRYVQLAPAPDEAPVPQLTLMRAIAEAGFTITYQRRAWEIFTRFGGNWLDRIVVAAMDALWGQSGYVWMAVLKKA